MSTAVPAAERAVIFGSGLSAVPAGLHVERRIDYAALGWPQGGVTGHSGELLVAGQTMLAFGRAHAYEGWSREALERPVRDLAAAGVARLLVTCAAGGLAEDASPGELVVVSAVVDLQSPPAAEPPVIEVCPDAAVRAVTRAVGGSLPVRTGVYAAVAGPQYETPAETRWLAGVAEVVGMSAVHEVRAARACGVPVRLLAVVTNRAGCSLDHDEVLRVGRRAAAQLRAVLRRLLSDPAVWAASEGGR